MSMFDKPDHQELCLYDYQHANIDCIRDGFSQGHRIQMFYASTGFGKTECAILIMKLAAEKKRRVMMVMDRRILVIQTSIRLDKYGIEHSIIMAGTERYDPHNYIQICSIQTLEAMGTFPDADLLIYDEAHGMRKSVIDFIQNNKKIKALGCSASPFTKGLGDIYTHVSGCTTTKQLVEDHKKLASLRIFICREIDMQGCKKVANEWTDGEVTKRGVQITGDVVTSWQAKTIEIFGEPRKTIVFCAGLAHGINLAENFKLAGHNFVAISYKDEDEYKAEVLREFAKPDSKIIGVISCEILVKGFDCPDVMIGVDARPLSKSFSSHVQKMGRVMRSFPGKDFAVWIDHAGNYLRFLDDWLELYENGVSELIEGKESSSKPEPSDEKKEAAKCPKCGLLWETKGDTCTHCGHTRVRRNEVITVPGEMTELSGTAAKAEKYTPADKSRWYSELLGYCQEKGKPVSYALAVFHEKFEAWPHGKNSILPSPPGREVLGYIRSKNIAYAKGMAKRAKS